MNNLSEIKTRNGVSHPKNLEGYAFLLSTPTVFAMDLIGKNLQMNGIDALWFYPELMDDHNEIPSLYVKSGQQEHANSILASIDLLDFVLPNDK